MISTTNKSCILDSCSSTYEPSNRKWSTCEEKPLELANISQLYKRELSDWMYLCKSCHRRYDRGNKCKRGHEFDEENTRYDSNGFRICRKCRADYSRAYKAKFKTRLAADPIKYLGENI